MQNEYYSEYYIDSYNTSAQEFQEEYSVQTSMFSSYVFGVIMLMSGIAAIATANKTIAPIVSVVLFLIIGFFIHLFPGFRDRYARRAFFLMFSVCVLMTGLSQFYAITFFGELQTTIDANNFYTLVSNGLTTEKLTDIHVSAPLAIKSWQTLYSIYKVVGIENNGPWIGIILNSFTMSLAASLTVQTGRYLFGEDHDRLHLIGTMFAWCGIFWLFGALLLRDAFALLINVIVILVFVRVLSLPNFKNFCTLIFWLFFAIACMYFIRTKVIPLFVVIALLGWLSWSRRSGVVSIANLMLPIATFLLVILLYPIISPFVSSIFEYAGFEKLKYGTMVGSGAGTDSLGYRLIVSQPLPIRLIAGSFYMVINPIPLWFNFKLQLGEYSWLRGFHGLYMIVIMPGAFVGMGYALKKSMRGGIDAPAICFVLLFMIFNLLAVVLTSLEIRHIGIIVPSIILLAVIPNRKETISKSRIQQVAAIWFGFILVGHIMWALLRDL